MVTWTGETEGMAEGSEIAGSSNTARVAWLDDLASLDFDGPDVVDFLQGYLTTDAAALDVEPRFTAICNIKGRVVCTGYVWLEGSTATLLLHRSLRPVVLAFLRPYLAFSRTSVAEGSASFLGAFGAGGAASHVKQLDGDRHLLVVEDPSLVEELHSRTSLDTSAWNRAAIERREVWLQAETSGAFLPQMLGLDELGAVSFTKGCYLGQEVVARAQHRGRVKRQLSVLGWQGVQPSVGAVIMASERQVGTVVAAAQASENAVAGTALGVLQVDHKGPLNTSGSATSLIP